MQATCALYNIPVIDTPFEARCRASSSAHPCKSLTTRALAAKERIRSSPLSCSVFQLILLSKIETMPLTSSPPLDVHLHSTRQATSRTEACIEYVRLRSEPYRTKRRTMRGVSFLNVATMESALICMAGIYIVGRRIYNSDQPYGLGPQLFAMSPFHLSFGPITMFFHQPDGSTLRHSYSAVSL